MIFIINATLEMLNNPKIVSGSISYFTYHLMARGRKTILIMPTAGIEPGPPTQQASGLSITPMPLASNIHNEKPNFLHL